MIEWTRISCVASIKQTMQLRISAAFDTIKTGNDRNQWLKSINPPFFFQKNWLHRSQTKTRQPVLLIASSPKQTYMMIMTFRCVLGTLLLLGKLKACYSKVTTDLPYLSSILISCEMHKESKGHLSWKAQTSLSSFPSMRCSKLNPVILLCKKVIAILQDVSLTFNNYVLLNLTQEKRHFE